MERVISNDTELYEIKAIVSSEKQLLHFLKALTFWARLDSEKNINCSLPVELVKGAYEDVLIVHVGMVRFSKEKGMESLPLILHITIPSGMVKGVKE